MFHGGSLAVWLDGHGVISGVGQLGLVLLGSLKEEPLGQPSVWILLKESGIKLFH